MSITLPTALLKAAGVEEGDVSTHAARLLALELFREDRGASISIAISCINGLQHMGCHRYNPYFRPAALSASSSFGFSSFKCAFANATLNGDATTF